jgi:heme A synthase
MGLRAGKRKITSGVPRESNLAEPGAKERELGHWVIISSPKATMASAKPTYHAAIYGLAVFTAIWCVVLLIAGALVTSNAAALAFLDWPKANGAWIPPQLSAGEAYQYAHRAIAGVLGLLTLLLTALLWAKEERKWVRWFGVVALGCVVAQSVLGGEIVLQFLHYWLPVWHATFGQILFGAILAVAVVTSKWWVSERPQLEDRGSPSIHALGIVNALVIFAQGFLGAGFRHNDMPFWPHTAGALAVLVTVVWTAVALRKRFAGSRELKKMRMLLHSVFGVQFLLGFGAYWAHVKNADAIQATPATVILTVTHAVLGALLFAVALLTVLLTYRLVPSKNAVRVSSEGRVAVP